METQVFNIIVDNVVEEIKARLKRKGVEYTPDGITRDRLWNFKEAARINHWSVLQAWQGMWTKHDISIRDFLRSEEIPDADVAWEKVLDDICYKILLLGLWDEQREKILRAESSAD